MHAGFAALRRDMSMNIRRRIACPQKWRDDTRADIQQLEAVWGDLLNRFGGPFLFGARSIADAMFAPVATRLRTYAVEISPQARGYCETIFADAAFQEWERAAEAETWTIEQTEALYR
jgi:glutathione S-transferase